MHQPDAGAIRVDGHEVLFDGPADARDAGIAIIYQEPILFPDLTVEENIFIGRQPLTTGRRIDRRSMRTHVEEVFERLGVRLDPARIARGLSIAEQQIVEIGKALSLDAKVIVMDEPTAALSAVEVERLFGVVESLRAEGAAVLFISHRLEEIFALCQAVTVLRDGRWVMSSSLEGLTVRRPRARDGRTRASGTGDRGDRDRARPFSRSSASPARDSSSTSRSR